MALALFPQLPIGRGFAGFSIAYNTRHREEVYSVLAEAEAAGATILEAGTDVFCGGYSGYVVDPDGFL